MVIQDERKRVIKNIQKFLNITESGIYDEYTRNAVISFQRNSGVEASGVVNYSTFVLMRDFYREQKNKKEHNVGSDFALYPGEYGDGVASLISELRCILNTYEYEHPLPSGALYDYKVKLAVNHLRGVFGLRELDYVESEFYTRLKREIITADIK